MYLVAIKMGRRQGARSGAYLNRYVTDEQRGRRPILIATRWAGAGWLFFCVAHSTRMSQIWALVRALKKQPTDLRQNACYFGDKTLGIVIADNRSRADAKRSAGMAVTSFANSGPASQVSGGKAV